MAPFTSIKDLLQPYSIYTSPKTERGSRSLGKKNHQLPICYDLKERQIEHEERKRLGTHVEKEPSSSNYTLGHYSFLTTETPAERNLIPHIYRMIFFSKETCSAVIPTTDITLVTQT